MESEPQPAAQEPEVALPASRPKVHRLHPSSLLFEIGKSFFSIVVMGLIVLFLAAGDKRDVVYMFLFVPVVLSSVLRYITFRYSLAGDHFVIREGLIFRKTRHVPFARIQNIDTVQGPLHRVLGVVEARLETAAGQEPEAVFRVVSMRDLERIRAGVFSGRFEASDDDLVEADAAFFRMRPGDVLLFGLLSQKGLAYVGGLLALSWEFDLWDRLSGFLAEGRVALSAIQVYPWILAIVVLAFLVLLQALTVMWAFLTLYGFHIVRRGDDLRTACGLLTRQTATIPRERIQFLRVREGWLHRLFGRTSVKVLTAGGDSTRDSQVSRKYLVPLADREELHEVLAEVQPEALPGELEWQGVHPRARGRMFRKWLVALAIPAGLLLRDAGWWGLTAVAPLIFLAYLLASLRARRLGWAVSDKAVFLRDGRLAHTESCVRFAKIQSVVFNQTPFDRRLGMARLQVDTAGSGSELAFVIPYLDRGVASELMGRLRRQAAAYEFTW